MWFLLTHSGRRLPIPELPASLGSGDSASVLLRDPSVQPMHAWLLPGAATGLRLEVCEGATVEIDGWALRQADLQIGDEMLVGTLRLQVGRGQPSPGSTRGPTSGSTSGAGTGTATARTRKRAPLASGTPRPAHRQGLLHSDLGQLSVGTRCILGLALLLLAAAIVWAAQALVVSLA